MFKIVKIKIASLQSIGSDGLLIENLRSLNVFIGKNNSGKTSLLEAIRRFFSPNPQENLSIFKNSKGETPQPAVVEICFEMNADIIEKEEGFNSEEKEIMKNYGRKVWAVRDLQSPELAKFKEFDINLFPPDVPDIATYQARLNEGRLRDYFGSKLQDYITRVQSEKRVGILFAEHNRRALDSQDDGGQTIVQRWSLGKNNPEDRYSIQRFLSEFPNLNPTFLPFDFFTTNAPGQVSSNDILSQVGTRPTGGIITQQFRWEGSGEKDSSVIVWLLSDPKKDILLIDEPENSKHSELQRTLYSLMLEKSSEKQLFVFTHSPIFAQVNDKSSVYLLSKEDRDKGSQAIHISGPEKYKFIRVELGTENSDLFFASSILFVEGYTEEKALPLIFDVLGYNLTQLGIEIINVKGGANIDEHKLKEFLSFIKDFGIKPYVFADRDRGVLAIKKRLTESHKEILANRQFVLWNQEFEDEFSDPELYEALKRYLEKYNFKIDITLEQFSRTRVLKKKKISNYLKLIYNRITKRTISKSEFGEILGSVVAENIKSEKVRQETKVERAIKEYISFLKP